VLLLLVFLVLVVLDHCVNIDRRTRTVLLPRQLNAERIPFQIIVQFSVVAGFYFCLLDFAICIDLYMFTVILLIILAGERENRLKCVINNRVNQNLE
jgi:hypothetical protein